MLDAAGVRLRDLLRWKRWSELDEIPESWMSVAQFWTLEHSDGNGAGEESFDYGEFKFNNGGMGMAEDSGASDKEAFERSLNESGESGAGEVPEAEPEGPEPELRDLGGPVDELPEYDDQPEVEIAGKDHVICSINMPVELWARMKQESEVKQITLRSIVRAALEDHLHGDH